MRTLPTVELPAVKAPEMAVGRHGAETRSKPGRIVTSRHPSHMSRPPIPVHSSRGIPMPWMPDPAKATGVAPFPVVVGDPSPRFGRDPGQTDRRVDPPSRMVGAPPDGDVGSPNLGTSIGQPSPMAMKTCSAVAETRGESSPAIGDLRFDGIALRVEPTGHCVQRLAEVTT